MKLAFTSKEIVKHCKKQLPKVMEDLQKQISGNAVSINPGAFTADVNSDLPFKLIKSIYKKVLPDKELVIEEALIYIGHYLLHNDKSTSTPLTLTMDQAKGEISSSINNKGVDSVKTKIQYRCMDKFQKLYMEGFKAKHWGIMPKTWEEIVEICQQKKIDAS